MRDFIKSGIAAVSSFTKKAGTKLAAGVGMVTAGAMTMAAGTQTALAQSALGTAAAAAVQDVQSDVNGALLILVIVVFVLVAWAYLKRAK